MADRPASTEYAALEKDDMSSYSEVDSGESLLYGRLTRHGKRVALKPSFSCNLAAFSVLVTAFAVSMIAAVLCTLWYERGTNPPRQRTVFSPVYDMVDVPMTTTFVDSSPAPNASNPEHIYRLPPSSEVDDAWDRLTNNIGIFSVSSQDVVRMGKDPKLSVMPPDSWGFPPNTHMMGIEAFHHLHCLNALRKGLVTNYHYYWGSRFGFAPTITFERHLNHCVDMLRQHLMCHADLEAYTFNWREGQLRPYADFAIQKQCIDFDYLLDWAATHKLPDQSERWGKLVKPLDAIQLEAPLDLPEVTNKTTWSSNGRVPLAPITGLEGKEYCLGDWDGTPA